MAPTGARLRRGELGPLLRAAIAELPAAQRAVVTLRDVEGWSSDEVSDALGLSAADQRALLHRARSVLHRTIATSFEAAA